MPNKRIYAPNSILDVEQYILRFNEGVLKRIYRRDLIWNEKRKNEKAHQQSF